MRPRLERAGEDPVPRFRLERGWVEHREGGPLTATYPDLGLTGSEGSRRSGRLLEADGRRWFFCGLYQRRPEAVLIARIGAATNGLTSFLSRVPGRRRTAAGCAVLSPACGRRTLKDSPRPRGHGRTGGAHRQSSKATLPCGCMTCQTRRYTASSSSGASTSSDPGPLTTGCWPTLRKNAAKRSVYAGSTRRSCKVRGLSRDPLPLRPRRTPSIG
jgi:hypothetical protein